jgi:acyl-CoA hydrolase
MTTGSTRYVDQPQACVDHCVSTLGQRLIVGAPLALGKPNHLVNAFYTHARAHPELRLSLFTALSLNPPQPGGGLQRRFLGPFLERHFGDYPRLAYLDDLDRNAVPDNIEISEFYFRSGSRLRNAHAQRHYVSSNYTHVARDMQARGVNVLVQMVAIHPQRPGYFSLSSNPDITLELAERMAGHELICIAQVNPELPYMQGDAEVPEDFFQLVLTGQAQPLFGVPRMPVSDADYLIGLYASALIRDRGTLQLGIGSLGDAVALFTGMRHKDNARYRKILQAAEGGERISGETLRAAGGSAPFESGLYAASEMFMDGFLHLYDDGVLKRRVYDHTGLQTLLNAGELDEELKPDTLDVLWRHGLLPDRLRPADLGWLTHFGILAGGVEATPEEIRCPGGRVPNALDRPANRSALARLALGERLANGALLHAAFFLGSNWMYQRLNGMDDAERRLFQMTRVSRINQLYRNEDMDRAQRLNARCVNTTMKVTLLGAAVSDQLENGQVVSGVGGQYNFVAMAHALDNSRSLLMLRSWRDPGGRPESNVVWEFPHETIPRHLRDIVITEYGVADLRGASDEETIQRLLCITDSRWQEPLRRLAVRHRKLHPDWRVPTAFCSNTPEHVSAMLAPFRADGTLGDYPVGCDFTPEEQRLARALMYLRERQEGRRGKAALLLSALGRAGGGEPAFAACLERMGLAQASGWRERLERRLMCLALGQTRAPDRPPPDTPQSST